jgi:hypothetical protein
MPHRPRSKRSPRRGRARSSRMSRGRRATTSPRRYRGGNEGLNQAIADMRETNTPDEIDAELLSQIRSHDSILDHLNKNKKDWLHDIITRLDIGANDLIKVLSNPDYDIGGGIAIVDMIIEDMEDTLGEKVVDAGILQSGARRSARKHVTIQRRRPGSSGSPSTVPVDLSPTPHYPWRTAIAAGRQGKPLLTRTIEALQKKVGAGFDQVPRPPPNPS